jgi:hypothetical protein
MQRYVRAARLVLPSTAAGQILHVKRGSLGTIGQQPREGLDESTCSKLSELAEIAQGKLGVTSSQGDHPDF